MSRFWVRRPSTSQESLATGLVAIVSAAAAGAVAWYVTRTFLARDSISLRPEDLSALGRPRPEALRASNKARLAEGIPDRDALE